MTEEKGKPEELKNIVPEDKGRILLSFIVKTKNGEYAKIEDSSLPYSRIVQGQENIGINDDNYYYSIS